MSRTGADDDGRGAAGVDRAGGADGRGARRAGGADRAGAQPSADSVADTERITGAPSNAAVASGDSVVDVPTAASGMDLARQALAAARAASRRSAASDGSATRGSNSGAGPSRSGTRVGGPGGPASRSRSGRRGSGEPQLSGARPDERDPQPVGGLVSRITEERGWSQDLAVGGVLGRWADLVGAELAAHCQPETFDDGLLVVRTDSTAWATQVRLLAPTLLTRLAEEVGPDVVRRVQVRGPSAPSWRKGPLSIRGRGPRDTYG